jgi:hypothetical protein
MRKSLKVGAALSASFGSRSAGLQSVAHGPRHAQRSVSRQPGMEQAHGGVHRKLSSEPAVLRGAIRPPRVRRTAAGCQQPRHQARNRPPARSARPIAAVDPKTLEPRERFDREYLLAVVDKDLFWLEKAKFPFSNPAWYIGNIDPDMYLNRNYAPLDVRMKAYIKYARGIPKMVTDIQANLQSAAAQDLRGAGHRPVRRIRRVLFQGRGAGVRVGERSRFAEAADRCDTARRRR